MKIFGDYHTHTTYTHGINTIRENVLSAKNKGIKEIAITEHCFNHCANGIKTKDYDKIQSEISCINKEKDLPKVLFGIEANLLDYAGNIDLTSEQIEKLDLLVVGYHKLVKSTKPIYFLTFVLKNLLCNMLKFFSKKQIERNTNAYICLLEKYDVDIVAHLNYAMKVDTIKVAKKCIETNTFIELNGKRTFFTRNEIDKMVEMGVKFIINSDAHSAKRVGDGNIGINLAIKYNIPLDSIANINKIPSFKNHKKKMG